MFAAWLDAIGRSVGSETISGGSPIPRGESR
jgi:hypothetical protein